MHQTLFFISRGLHLVLFLKNAAEIGKTVEPTEQIGLFDAHFRVFEGAFGHFQPFFYNKVIGGNAQLKLKEAVKAGFAHIGFFAQLAYRNVFGKVLADKIDHITKAVAVGLCGAFGQITALLLYLQDAYQQFLYHHIAKQVF
jgi:hypothetical protein